MKPIKTSKKLILAFAAMVVMGGFASRTQAQIIYSDTLTGIVGYNDAQVYGTGPGPGGTFVPDPLNGSTPDTVDTGGNGGTSGATWSAQSDWQRTQLGVGAYYSTINEGDNAFLPFTPVVGTSYVLQATLASPGGVMNTELGFVGSNTLQTGNGGLYPDTEVATIQLNYTNPNAVFSTNGSYGTNSAPFTPIGSDKLNVQITLTAVGSGWTASAVGIDLNTSTTVFSLSPVTLTDASSIGFVGFDSNVNNDLVSNFSLTAEPAAVPEPTTWTLMGLGALALVVTQRRRMAKDASV